MNQSTANEKMWEQKEKRELFCKAVNTFLMTDKDKVIELDIILKMSKKIIDEAFKNYSAPEDKKEEQVDIPTD